MGAFAPGTPRATFLPSTSIEAPASLAAVNLEQLSLTDENRDKRPGMNQAKGNGIGANTKGTPFFADRFSQTDDSGLCRGVVCLPDIAMQATG